jgi:hypothetical protein
MLYPWRAFHDEEEDEGGDRAFLEADDDGDAHEDCHRLVVAIDLAKQKPAPCCYKQQLSENPLIYQLPEWVLFLQDKSGSFDDVYCLLGGDCWGCSHWLRERKMA